MSVRHSNDIIVSYLCTSIIRDALYQFSMSDTEVSVMSIKSVHSEMLIIVFFCMF